VHAPAAARDRSSGTSAGLASRIMIEQNERKLWGARLQAPRKGTAIMGRTNPSRLPKPVSVTLELAEARSCSAREIEQTPEPRDLDWRMASCQSVASRAIVFDAAVGCWSRGSTDALLQHLDPTTAPEQKSFLWGAERSELLGKMEILESAQSGAHRCSRTTCGETALLAGT
jgi:hypothetical protein